MGSLKDPGNYAASTRFRVPRERLRVSRREVPPGYTATDSRAFIVYR